MEQPQHSPLNQDLVFLKLGGSLITDKSQPHTVREEVLARVAGEISAAREMDPTLKIVIGHGSGSYGHTSGDKYGTRGGVRSENGWQGFSQVWFDAAQLNQVVMRAFHQAQLPAVAFPPSASAFLDGREVRQWSLDPLRKALDHHLLPVVYGDVVFDDQIGGTILSTEEIFKHIAPKLHPARILLAGKEPGVWKDYPHCTEIIPEITPKTISRLPDVLRESGETDVTGGMATKVRDMLSLVEKMPGLEVWVFSGREDGQIATALTGSDHGTYIHL